MSEPEPAHPAPEREPRRCPSCGSRLDSTGAGSDELLECSQCGLVMFDDGRRR